MLSIEQLNEIRTRVSRELQVRYPAGRLLVSVGTVGIAAGARQVMSAALDEINHLGLQLVVAGEQAEAEAVQLPIVRVLLPEQSEQVYTKVTPEQVRQIVRNLATVAASN